jgi:hypothetical protein
MPAGGLIVGGAGAVANAAGAAQGAAAAQPFVTSAQQAAQGAFARLAAIGIPPNIAQPIVYNQFKQQGIMTPELESAINQAPSQMAGVQGNQQAQQAQLQALQILQQTGQTGMTPQSQAALAQIRQQVAADTNSKQQAIQQQFAAQGQGGSGAQLIGELQNAQSGANQESTAGNQVAAMAAQNALQAIGQAGTLGGQIQGQQFGEQAQKAQAQDIINQFNTANQLGVQQQNVGASNQAQAQNLANQQALANANTQQANQELLRQNQAQNQEYLESLGAAQTINQGAQGYAGTMTGLGSQAAQSASAPYTAIGSGLGAVGSYMNSNSNSPSNGGGSNNSVSNNYYANNEGSVLPGSPLNAPIAPSQNQSAFARGGIIAKYNEGGDAMDYQGGKTTDYRQGGPVPGRAPVKGDSPKNDIVKAMLSPGEMVVPRTLAKTTFGKKLAKLLEMHHEVMDHQKHGDLNDE